MLVPAHAMAGVYDDRLVVVSVLIAVMASYAALDLAGRVTSAHGLARTLWLSGGATAMGIGIWAMHYVGMLAFRLPVAVEYDWPGVLLSLLAAILASAIALFVVSRKEMSYFRAIIGSIFMGSGIAGMHYIGMDAMRLPATCHYSRVMVAVSVALAMVISLVALSLSVSFSRGDEVGQLAEGAERGGDGRGGTGDALHGNGSGQFHAGDVEPWRPVARAEHIFAGGAGHHHRDVHGAGTDGADVAG